MGRLDDVIGRGFVLMSTADLDLALSGARRDPLEDLGCRLVQLGADEGSGGLVDEDGVHTTYLRELGAVAYLARPDYVLFGAAATSADIGGLVEDLRTAVAWTAAPAPVGA